MSTFLTALWAVPLAALSVAATLFIIRGGYTIIKNWNNPPTFEDDDFDL